ncbi:MAG: isochorismatase family protein [Candidatus Melainabacteria bacterium]|nr:isochorismatase family protein [Candidatus Melainabacteria bacterium]
MNNHPSFNRGQGTLVVVDMQPDYEAALHPWTISNVTKEVTAARHNNWGIVIVEFYDHEPTIKAVMRPLLKKTRYEKLVLVEKDIPDGSTPVVTALEQNGFSDSLIRVCGVNTHECVQDTVNGLARRLPDSSIEVITGACNCHTKLSWKSFHKEANVSLKGNWWLGEKRLKH